MNLPVFDFEIVSNQSLTEDGALPAYADPVTSANSCMDSFSTF